jgi:beta-mannanase
MRRYLTILFVAILSATIGAAEFSAQAKTPRPTAKTASQTQLQLGVYDPYMKFKRVKSKRKMAIEHVFIAWQDFDAVDLEERAKYARQHHRRMMVTVEPWTHAANWTDGSDTLFSEILDGAYDEDITAVCTTISGMKRKPLVRWGHEMEEVTGRYPWAQYDSVGYIAAYRYFVTQCRTIATKALFVWSPIGHAQLSGYYPGDAYVDMIGFPVWGYQQADLAWYGHTRSFQEAVKEKYDRVKKYGKPLLIAELGVSGSRKYENGWLRKLKDAAAMFPKVKALVYFNMPEPAAWPDGLGKPDWRVSPKRLR